MGRSGPEIDSFDQTYQMLRKHYQFVLIGIIDYCSGMYKA